MVKNTTEIVFRDETHCQCVTGNIYTLYTLGEASSDNIHKLVTHFDRFATSARGDIACIIITGAATSPPDGDDRRKVANVMAKHRARLKGLAIVLQAEGFRGAIIRSVAAGIFILPNPGYPTKFFAKPGDSSAWVAERIDSTSTQVRAAIDDTIKIIS
ncbi:MAG: hypothetical protein ACI9KE_000625 [Polyangiales bacterium]